MDDRYRQIVAINADNNLYDEISAQNRQLFRQIKQCEEMVNSFAAEEVDDDDDDDEDDYEVQHVIVNNNKKSSRREGQLSTTKRKIRTPAATAAVVNNNNDINSTFDEIKAVNGRLQKQLVLFEEVVNDLMDCATGCSKCCDSVDQLADKWTELEKTTTTSCLAAAVDKPVTTGADDDDDEDSSEMMANTSEKTTMTTNNSSFRPKITTIDVNDIIVEYKTKNERFGEQLSVYREVFKELIVSVKQCNQCQENELIIDTVKEFKCQIKMFNNNNGDDNDGNNFLDDVMIGSTDDNDIDGENNNNDDESPRPTNQTPKSSAIEKVGNEQSLDDGSDGDNQQSTADSTTAQTDSTTTTIPTETSGESYEDQLKQLKAKCLTPNGNYICDLCDYGCRGFKSFESHVNRHHRHIKPYKCDICGHPFADQSDVLKHKRFKHYAKGEGLDQLNEKQIKQFNYSLQKYKCRYCDKVIYKNNELREHIKSRHLRIKPNKSLYCDLCGKLFACLKSLNLHMRVIHAVGKSVTFYTCDWLDCQFRTHNISALKSHKNRHMGIKDFLCGWPGCEHRTVTKRAIEDHRLVHTTERNYQCQWPGCEFVTKTDWRLKSHTATVHEDRPALHICHWPGCDKKFPFKTQLTSHMDVHRDPTYPCPICEKLFKSKRSLRGHRLIHQKDVRKNNSKTGIKDYTCEWPGCDFITNSVKNLKSHTQRLHEDSPAIYGCHWPGCDKKFRFKTKLSRHMKIHNEPHIPCPQCNKMFKCKSYLDSHLQFHRKSIDKNTS
ncbi:zinc finger protein 83-like isoform X2 [Oppia nitens]|uniref:zinc finger protein 83-like isoform X2 n=1 Tax=Oppia nitens TaxID=1686743 RepID=UPI0023DAB9C5|nr:zinc finger protein 83-like isoform X2 [Oppia nitens]